MTQQLYNEKYLVNKHFIDNFNNAEKIEFNTIDKVKV